MDAPKSHLVRSVLVSVGISLGLLVVGAVGAAAATPGDPDPTFSTDGVARFSLGGYEGARSLFRDSRGRTILAGRKDGRIVLVRLSPGGALDRSFSGDGKVLLDPTGSTDAMIEASRGPGGRIVVLAERWQRRPGRPSVNVGYTLVRFTGSGRLDRSFGGDGIVTAAYGGDPSYPYARDVLVLPDSRILVVTEADGSSVLRRYLANGQLDRRFGTNGSVRVRGIAMGSLVLQPNGRIIVAGGANPATGPELRARRFRGNGDLDRSFANGFARLRLRGAGIDQVQVSDAIRTAGGRLYVGGRTFDTSRWTQDGLVAAFTVDGRPATAFAGTGWRRVDHLNSDRFLALAVTTSGRLVAAGGTTDATMDPDPALPGQPMLAMFRPDGTLDTGFGDNGIAVIDTVDPDRSQGEDPAWLALVVAGGRITVAGYSTASVGNADILAGRFLLSAS